MGQALDHGYRGPDIEIEDRVSEPPTHSFAGICAKDMVLSIRTGEEAVAGAA